MASGLGCGATVTGFQPCILKPTQIAATAPQGGLCPTPCSGLPASMQSAPGSPLPLFPVAGAELQEGLQTPSLLGLVGMGSP